jgi:hypothetical protein
MYDSLSEGGVFYGRSVLLLIGTVAVAVLLQLL